MRTITVCSLLNYLNYKYTIVNIVIDETKIKIHTMKSYFNIIV